MAKKRKVTPEHDLPVGTIFVFSWGYDQTNVNFYQVVATTPKTVTIREIAQESLPGQPGCAPMSDLRVPIPHMFRPNKPEMRKRVQFLDGEPYLTMASYGWCSVWDGKPEYNSWDH
jgi:hypothetical protein